ncbi:MAG TPA: transposase [Acidobacteriota bacterium]|nr:transposase [Acidobacteriota bacterium]
MDDVCDSVEESGGAGGMTGEQVLRCGVLKQWQSLSYRKLAFHLSDSISFRRFCRLPPNWTPSSSCLQANPSKVRAQTWRRVNARLVLWAKDQKLEDGRRVREDATAVAVPIAEPEHSQMLSACVRVGTRLLKDAVRARRGALQRPPAAGQKA